MSDLTMIGLGAMGSALARAFVEAGHAVTVWNRTQSRARPLVALGARSAPSLPEAIRASEIVAVCIDNYDVTRQLIEHHGAGGCLRGRVFVQLSTGTPSEARDFGEWITGLGAHYVDGAIMPYPDEVGDDDARFLFAGPADAYARCEPFMRCLGGDLRYLGPETGSAAALDMALLTHDLCNYVGALHAAHVCELEGVGLDVLASMFPDGSPEQGLARRIHQRRFADPGATLAVWEAAVQRIQRQARDAGGNGEVPDLISRLFNRAIEIGRGDEHIAAVIDVMRSDHSAPSGGAPGDGTARA